MSRAGVMFNGFFLGESESWVTLSPIEETKRIDALEVGRPPAGEEAATKMEAC